MSQSHLNGRPDQLRFGLFHGPHHAMNLDPTYAFQRDLMLMEYLDRLGFDEAWIGEHHSGGFEIIAAPEVFLAAAAERTRHIRLGTGVKSLPYHHPLIVAETIAQLDHMTRGRAMFGVGPGALPSDAAMFGLKPADLRPRMEQALEAIVPLLRGETVSMKTDWFELAEARLGVGCYTHPMIETAVTSVRSPAGVVAAGKYGAGVLVLGGIDDAALAHHIENWQIYEATCAQHGHVADRSKWRITMFIHVAESREQAWKDCEYGLRAYIEYANDVVPNPNPIPRGLPDPVAYINESRRGIIGTPDDVIREVERVHEALGGFGALLIFQNDWANWPASLRSLELIAEEVRPHFTGANRLRQASYARIAPHSEDNRSLARVGVAEAVARFEARSKANGADGAGAIGGGA
jgi:limonene 1,2-monooxygenase